MFNLLDIIPACDRQADRHLAMAQTSPRRYRASRGKNNNGDFSDKS